MAEAVIASVRTIPRSNERESRHGGRMDRRANFLILLIGVLAT